MATFVDLDSEGEVLWGALTASWTDQAGHDAFVQHCFRHGRLAAAGARYRVFLDSHPEDVVARRMCDRVVFLSMQALTTAERSPTRKAFFQSPWFVVVILSGAIVGALLGFVFGGRL